MMPGKKKDEKKKCSYEYKETFYKCSRSALPDKEHCIFHSKDIEGKKDKFNGAFWKEFERQKEHEEAYDFTGFVFPLGISFKEKKLDKDANFLGAQFYGVANFGASQFSGNANFSFAQFTKISYFYFTRFYDGTAFYRAKFKEEANFYFAHFSWFNNFIGVQFFGKAYFMDAQFFGKADFKDAQFLGKADFNKAKFNDEANFENITIEKFSSFEMIDTYFYNVSGLFEFIEENGKVFKKLRKRSKTLKTEFLPKNFRLILGDGVTARYPVQNRQIKDDMYLLDKKERISKVSGIRKYKDKTLYFLWCLFANYGRSFKRWAAWSLGFALTFGVVFYLYFLESPSSFQTVYISEGCPFFSFFYYSVVTFTTLGFGDIVPKCGWLQFWVMLEVILGYIMLGGLISILANKLARRS